MPSDVTMLHPNISPADWARIATAGETIRYFKGHLAHELGATRRRAVAFLDLSERGMVELSQKRLGPDDYVYIARRTALDWSPTRKLRDALRSGEAIVDAMLAS